MAKKKTIYDVADSSGTSPSTVAAVLNGTWAKRRISSDTADRVRLVARQLKYRANRQASGLRTARSGLIGMVLPLHDNRYFSSLSQHFELEARRRGMCPVVVSALRDPEEEKRTVATLISHNVDQMFIAGATDPDALSLMCAEADIPHINVDLPGRLAPSVISDNYWGAAQLTRQLLDQQQASGTDAPGEIYFLGGIGADHNTAERIRAFRDEVTARQGPPRPGQVIACGYDPLNSLTAMRSLFETLGRLPTALLVNSTIAFEGVFEFLRTLPASAFEDFVVGCYDWDPYLSYLHFPVTMVRQDARQIIERAFGFLDSKEPVTPEITLIRPQLVFP
jgi:LacI family transcriptional regulator, fructose operon transcriptional repressor